MSEPGKVHLLKKDHVTEQLAWVEWREAEDNSVEGSVVGAF